MSNFYDDMDNPKRRRESRGNRAVRNREIPDINGRENRGQVPNRGPLSGYGNINRDSRGSSSDMDKTQQIDPNMVLNESRNGKRNKKDNIENKNGKNKKGKAGKIFLIVILGIFIFLLITTIGIGIWGFLFLDDLKSEDLIKGTPPAKGEPLSIVIMGMDIGDTEDLDNKASRRTDTIMLFNYNPNTLKTHVVSIPRDTIIEASNGEITKINAAYGIGGEEEVISQVENFLEVNVNYVVEIDYAAFRGLIDAIGGIEMEIEQDMFYDDDGQNLHINFKGGTVEHLDGKKAEEFFRWRKNNDGSGLALGDIGRIEQQQKFISKLIAKCVSPAIAPRIPDIIDIIKANVQTNMDGSAIINAMFSVMKNLKPENLIMTTLQGRFEGADWAVDYGMNNDLIEALNAKENIPMVNKSEMKLLVLNGTSQPGLAGQVQSELLAEGYANIEVGNGDPRETGVIQTANKDLRDDLYNKLYINGHETTISAEYKGYDAVVIIGEDYFTMGEEE